ncbi:methyltransferase domain-containing protein [Candidatus Woesearchaeota archaeon]|nr:methyltransferase domain-containing protein [Candidatus Woesearchaeota archaeon]
MNDKLFTQIKKDYDSFYRNLLIKGRLPMWSTSEGFWNAAIADEIYDAFKKLKLNQFKNFLDIGSGDGKIVLIASLFCKSAEGVEIDSFLHSKAVQMQKKFGIINASFHNRDLFEHDFSKYDVLFSNPDAPLERGLESKLIKEMKGRLIIYGHHFHPRHLKKEESFLINGTQVSLYSKTI